MRFGDVRHFLGRKQEQCDQCAGFNPTAQQLSLKIYHEAPHAHILHMFANAHDNGKESENS